MKRSIAALAAGAALMGAGPASAQTAAPSAAPATSAPTTAPTAADDAAALQGAVAMAQLFNPAAKVVTSGQFAYLTLATTAGRTQNVFISALVIGPTGVQTRLISSTAAHLATLDPALLARLLGENMNGLPYGYWALGAPAADGTRTLAYELELRTDAPASAVQAAMTTAANRADALEAQLNPGKDVL